MNHPRCRAVALGAVLAMSGCAGRDHSAPADPSPAAWSAPTADAGVSLPTWWTAFGDAGLDAAIARAIEANHDLRLAGARLREARAQREQLSGALLPTVEANGSAIRSRPSANGQRAPIPLRTTTLFDAGFDAAWEIDLFGGVRRGIAAADAELAAADADRRAVQVSLIAEVARAWLECGALAERRALARESAANAQDTARVQQRLADAGLALPGNAAVAQAQAAEAAAAIAPLITAHAEAGHRLDLLLGRLPGGALPDTLPPRGADVALRAPGDVVRLRPDLIASERQLAAAVARVGVAQAELYPRLSLTGAFAYQSLSASTLLEGASRAWSVGPTLRLPIFDRGRLRAAVRVADARAEQALIRHERTVLAVLGECEDAFTRLTQARERRLRLGEALTARETALAAAANRRAQGLDNELAALEARERVRLARDATVVARLDEAVALVTVAKVMGGGIEVGP